jgi:hypothetical protein
MYSSMYTVLLYYCMCVLLYRDEGVDTQVQIKYPPRSLFQVPHTHPHTLHIRCASIAALCVSPHA